MTEAILLFGVAWLLLAFGLGILIGRAFALNNNGNTDER